MFAYLEGILTRKNPVNVVLDCQGVGYEMAIPLSTHDHLPETGVKVKLYIHYSFNPNDGARLFGFYTELEKNLFRLLISISKIGPKIALAILSGLAADDLISAIQQGNAGLIATIPGIGKKSAERLIIELQDKVTGLSPQEAYSTARTGSSSIIVEAESALLTLGYKTADFKSVLHQLLRDRTFSNAEEVVKAVIQTLYRQRSQ
ncbi:MAG: Holliday junction branch migration protein RuvA [Candidatus Cloacimonetes bacterium]|nr:Holliday junction branch migration protein RuvA [Candidatus Cloacimonadota bacterium]